MFCGKLCNGGSRFGVLGRLVKGCSCMHVSSLSGNNGGSLRVVSESSFAYIIFLFGNNGWSFRVSEYESSTHFIFLFGRRSGSFTGVEGDFSASGSFTGTGIFDLFACIWSSFLCVSSFLNQFSVSLLSKDSSNMLPSTSNS